MAGSEQKRSRPGPWFGRFLVFPSGSLKNVLQMAMGTALAQVVGILFLIPLARLYSPAAFGFFALFQSVVGLGVAIASLRYDVAIVLPKEDDSAWTLRRVSLTSILITSALISCILLLARSKVAELYGNENFASWLIAAGAVTFVSAQSLNIQYWLTRKRAFGAIATNRLLQALFVGASQLAAYAIFPNMGGLTLGLFAGALVTFLILLWTSRPYKHTPSSCAPTRRAMMARYKNMPLLNGPNAFVDAIRTIGMSGLIARIAVSGLGEYNMAFRMTMAPVTLIQGAIAQVFLQRMAVARPGELGSLLRRVQLRLFLVGAPVFTIYYLLAPWGFETLLGSEWALSGFMARALMPWAFMMTATSPSASVFIVTEKQSWLLLFSVVYTAVPLAWLAVSDLDFLGTVAGLGWLMAILRLVMTLLAHFAAKLYDSSAR